MQNSSYLRILHDDNLYLSDRPVPYEHQRYDPGEASLHVLFPLWLHFSTLEVIFQDQAEKVAISTKKKLMSYSSLHVIVQLKDI